MPIEWPSHIRQATFVCWSDLYPNYQERIKEITAAACGWSYQFDYAKKEEAP